MIAETGEVAAGPGETGDQAGRDRVPTPMKTIGIVEVALFAASAGTVPGGHDHINLAADEIGGQCGQPIIVALRPAVFHRQVLSLDIAGFAQSLLERGHKRHPGGRCAASAEEADHRHRLLLRVRGERPGAMHRRA